MIQPLSARHVFTPEEGELGVRSSKSSRRAQLKLEKKLAEMHLEGQTLSKVMDILKVILASPSGVFIVGSLAIDGLERIGYFGNTAEGSGNSSGTNDLNKIKSQGGLQGGAITYVQDFFKLFGDVNPLIPIVNQLTGGSLTGNTNAPGSLNAEILQGELFAICMAQALGGGQGISTLATSVIAGLK